jgi:hypothetical protein
VDQPREALVRTAHDKQLRRGVHRSTRELEATILRYIDITKPFVWTKTADEILVHNHSRASEHRLTG